MLGSCTGSSKIGSRSTIRRFRLPRFFNACLEKDYRASRYLCTYLVAGATNDKFCVSVVCDGRGRGVTRGVLGDFVVRRWAGRHWYLFLEWRDIRGLPRGC